MHALAVDIGGTKIAAAMVDKTGCVSHHIVCPTNAAEGAEAILERVITLARQVKAESCQAGDPAPIAVGVGTGGQVDPVNGDILYATPLLPGWTGTPLRAELESALDLPVAVDNDVHVTGLGEARHGAGKGCQQLVVLAVGTGIGGALIQNGQLYRGATGLAGHLGHVSIDALHGRRCNCGHIGCVEMYASGPAIEAEWRQQVSAVSTETWLGKPPKDVSVKDIASLVSRAGKAGRESRSILDQAGRHLGYALVSLLHAFDPEKVVIGGGVAQVGEPFFQGVRAIVRQHAAPTVRHVPILPAALGSNAALIGAAELAFQTYHDRD